MKPIYATAFLLAAYAVRGSFAAQPILKDLDALPVGRTVAVQTNEAVNVSVYPAPASRYDKPNYKMPENLGRGVIAVRCGDEEAFVTWRYLESDPRDVVFRVNGCDETQLCWAKVNYDPSRANTYVVTARDDVGGELVGGAFILPAQAGLGYIEIPLNGIEPTTTRTNGVLNAEFQGLPITYAPGDCSVGDLDGDGEHDIVIKWNPSRHQDNTGEGDTGFTYYEGVKLDGTSLWRVCMGPNIRSGEHYSPFVVWDFDGDGKSELVVKTADGTVDGKGNIIGHPVLPTPYDCATQGNQYDSRDKWGTILSGNEYLTVFSGEDGRELETVQYVPVRGDHTNKDSQGYWGDTYGNRSERYLACVAYLDGKRPSVVMCRGYYARTALTAWNWDGTHLSRVWAFDTTNTTASAYQHGTNKDFAGQGFHTVRAGDVDFDGKDEIIYGSMVVDHDGTGLHSTGGGHGDALHLIQSDSARRGLQAFSCLESGNHGLMLYEPGTGVTNWWHHAGSDTPRAMTMDADPYIRGYEFWGGNAMGVFDRFGEAYTPARVNGSYVHSMCMAVWWGGDFVRYSLSGNTVNRWDPELRKEVNEVTFTGTHSINSTKSTQCFQGDMYGDWREEVLLPTTDDAALRLYVSTNSTPYKFHTFLQDPIYRMSEATEQNGYNQPTGPGFYFGPDLHGHRMWFRGQYLE